jgi:hypothetical protein
MARKYRIKRENTKIYVETPYGEKTRATVRQFYYEMKKIQEV